MAKRTLQNRLKTLVESETLVVDSKGKATRYKIKRKESLRYVQNLSTKHIDKKDKLHFDNVIIEELESLHEGNIA